MINNSSILIKPASSLCNMNCLYCFYKDEIKNRSINKPVIMDDNTSFNIIKKAISNTEYSISFTFQGGEPLLSGIEYYKKFIKTVNELNTRSLKIYYSIQTNGTLLDEEYCKFFKENNFLVGISLDGYKELNDKYRKLNNSEGSYDLVISKIKILDKYKVDYNILSVVTKDLSSNIKEVYLDNRRNNFNYLQFIRVLNPINSIKEEYSLSVKDYQKFLIKMFKYWYKDILRDKRWYSRYFDSILNILYGMENTECTLSPKCFKMYSIEGNGDTYPCDFYMLDEYLLGNINENDFDYFDKKIDEIGFLDDNLDKECLNCKYKRLCNGGCKRERVTNDGINKNFYCDAFKGFFKYSNRKYKHLIKLIKNHRI